MTQKNPMIVVLSYFLVIIYILAGMAISIVSLPRQSGVVWGKRNLDYEEFGAVPLLGCSLVFPLCLCSFLYFGLDIWHCVMC